MKKRLNAKVSIGFHINSDPPKKKKKKKDIRIFHAKNLKI